MLFGAWRRWSKLLSSSSLQENESCLLWDSELGKAGCKENKEARQSLTHFWLWTLMSPSSFGNSHRLKQCKKTVTSTAKGGQNYSNDTLTRPGNVSVPVHVNLNFLYQFWKSFSSVTFFKNTAAELRITYQHFDCTCVFGVYNGKVGFVGRAENALIDLKELLHGLHTSFVRNSPS